MSLLPHALLRRVVY